MITHLLRNAIDHGIEAPEERRDKATEAVVILEARSDGSCFEFVLTDDGRGIDAQAVVAKAVSRGVIDASRAEELTRVERLQLIFEPGLSTAEVVTDTSGRGVGMAAVREVVDSLGGTITVETELGVGTSITLRVPLDVDAAAPKRAA